MEALLGIALLAAIAYFIVRRRRGGTAGKRLKCHDCRHARKLFDDGVMCGFGEREVFKNRRHIAMCPDWEQESK